MECGPFWIRVSAVENRFVFLHHILFVKCLKFGWTYLIISPCTSDVGEILRFLLHALSLEVLANEPAYQFWCIWSGDQSTGDVQWSNAAVWLQHVINQLQIFNTWITCKRVRKNIVMIWCCMYNKSITRWAASFAGPTVLHPAGTRQCWGKIQWALACLGCLDVRASYWI